MVPLKILVQIGMPDRQSLKLKNIHKDNSLLDLMEGWFYCIRFPLHYRVVGQSRVLPHQGASTKSLEIILYKERRGGPQLLDSESR